MQKIQVQIYMEPTVPTGADLLVESLYRHGVRDIFGMPGSHSTSIYDALVRHGGIRTILIRNEQAGAYAADGYARATGRPGVICTTAGPGATNALSGIAEAYSDGVPVLLITGQVNHDRVHQECGLYHEIDLEGIFRPCTRWCKTVMTCEQIPTFVDQAMGSLFHPKPRPAALILPQDLMVKESNARPSLGVASTWQPLQADIQELAKAVDLLAQAERPLILAGGGALWSHAEKAIHQLAKRLHCPVITSLNGKGILDERDPYSLGHARSVRAKKVLPHADAMLSVGCRFTEVLTWFRTMPVPENLIHIDVDPNQININYPAKIGLVADARTTVEHLLKALPNSIRSNWGTIWEEAKLAKHPQPEWLIETLRMELPEDALVYTDASEMALRMQADFPAYGPRTFFYPSTYIALGWGFPAAIGAAVAKPDQVVVCLSGDGGFLMACQELATAVRYGLRLIILVHNDNAYGAIRHFQRNKFGARYRDTDLNNPNFLQLSQAFAIPAKQTRAAGELQIALREALERSGPSLIEIPDQWRSLRVEI